MLAAAVALLDDRLSAVNALKLLRTQRSLLSRISRHPLVAEAERLVGAAECLRPSRHHQSEVRALIDSAR